MARNYSLVNPEMQKLIDFEDQLREMAGKSAFNKMPPTQPPIEPLPEQREIAATEAPIPVSASPEVDPQEMEMRRLLAERDARLEPAIQAERDSLGVLKGELQKLKDMPQGINFAPLLAYADQLSGGKSLAGYIAPDSAEGRQEKVVKLQDLIQKAQTGLTGREIQALNDKLSYKLLGDSGRQSRFQKSYDLKTREGLFKAFQGDSTTKDARTALAGAKGAKSLLDSDTAVGDQAFKTQLARAVGEKGPLTETDINTYAGSPAIAARINRAVDKMNTGRISEVDRQDMYKIIDILEKRQKANINTAIKRFSTRIAPKVYGVDSATAEEILGSADDFTSDLKVEDSGLSDEKRKRLEELRAKKAAGTLGQ